MPTDPFVAPGLVDLPRQETNLAPGVHVPAAKDWRADRPGDLAAGQPEGPLFGRPGPNVGYAILLTNRVADGFELGPHESRHDAIAVVSELGMKRAASFGRAPVTKDVAVAAKLLGFTGDCAPEFVNWRAGALRGADHDYDLRRRVVDAVPDAELRMPPQVPALLAEYRNELRRSLSS
ncbi:MAG: hypothetical protein ACHQDE_03165 [Acidimicrobiia bacterium]